MNNIFKIATFVIVAILQITLMPILNIKGMFPDLILVGAIVLILADFEEDAFLLAALGGLILDLVSPFFFGFNTFIFVGFLFLIRFLAQKILPEINLLLIFVVTLVFVLFFGFLENVFLGRMPSLSILIYGVYSSIIGLVFFLFLEKYAVKSQVIKIGIF